MRIEICDRYVSAIRGAMRKDMDPIGLRVQDDKH